MHVIKFYVLFINRSAVQDAGDTGITCLTVEKECEPGLSLGVSSRPPAREDGKQKVKTSLHLSYAP